MKTKLMLMCAVLLCSCGCEDRGNTGTVIRYARGTRAAGDGKTNVWIWYIDDFEQPLTQAGLRFARTDPDIVACSPYPSHPDIYFGGLVHLEGPNVTGEGGRIHIRGVFNPDGGEYNPDYYHWCENVWSGPMGPSAPISQVVHFATYNGSPYTMWPNDAHPTWNRPPKRPSTAKGSLSEEEELALSATTVGGGMMMMAMDGGDPNSDPNFIYLPDTGIDCTFTLLQQQGSDGYGYALQQSGFMPIDSDNWEDSFRYQSPFMYSVIVVSSEPVEAQGMAIRGKVKSNALPEGVVVDIEVVAQNAEKTIGILHTDYFLPVTQDSYDALTADPREPVIFDRWSDITAEEAHLYDPNNFPDPNMPPKTIDTSALDFMERHDPNRVKPLHYIPVETDDELRIEVLPASMSAFTLFASRWLIAGISAADINRDGIVNLNDLYN